MFNLLRYYSVTSFLAFLLIGAALTFFYRQQAIEELTQLKEQKLQDIATFLYHDFEGEIQQLLAGQSLLDFAAFEAEMRHHLGGSLVKLELFNSSGQAIFEVEAPGWEYEESQVRDDPTTLANLQDDHTALSAALQGKVKTELVFSRKKNETSVHNLIASYIPIRSEPDGAVIGVFEVYSNIDTSLADIQRTQTRVILLLAGLLTGLYILLLMIVEHAQKVLRWQHTQVLQYQASLEQEREHLKLEVAHRERAEKALALQADMLTVSNRSLEKSTQDLERSNQELEKFAYIASHDLQEPLRKVQTFGDRLSSKYADKLGEDGKLYISRMQEATGRMRVLIQDLLSYSRIQGDNKDFVTVNLNDIVNGVASDLEVRLEQSGGRIEVGDLPALQADPLQMRQVFQNLIGNALKFRKSDVAPVVKISSAVVGDSHEISVKDNGIGFEQQYADKVFDVFQRLHGRSDYEGTGIGLAIVRKVLEKHGGSVRVESSPGQGSQFYLTLPRVEQAQTPKVAEAVA
jgi:signal transduction histidine kinase